MSDPITTFLIGLFIGLVFFDGVRFVIRHRMPSRKKKKKKERAWQRVQIRQERVNDYLRYYK